jgi:hypothetical protein
MQEWLPMSYEPESPKPLRSPAADRVSLPAIFLIVVGALSILWGGYLAVNGAIAKANPQLVQQGIDAKQKQELEKQGFDMAGIVKGATTGYIVLGAISVISAILMIVGGIMMLRLRGYGIAVLGSVMALVPCLTPCCFLGIPFGIWALVVLSNAEVKEAFR